ncbi:hypothetical protein [Aporhodopirellula aestuarii]|uniref:Uncharacterized protein n=1 Tax=Aporhodopirellula aestuarii TaxID=2950107 RepID=A0ABT0TZY6_9BACT|nr:hypothetical protein [Aporhodopirellula aestuarii]MCM2370046.1 hypothetical protein [Aporhodopirellula aestuarii]
MQFRKSTSILNPCRELSLNSYRQENSPPQSRSRGVANQSRLIAAILVALGISLINVGPASAQDSQPSGFQKLNPMNWRMPSFRLPNFLVPNSDQERIVERKEGLVSDIKGTASRSWQRTKETFNPARLNPMNMFAGASDTAETKKEPGFFSSLLSPAPREPEERVATVNDWLDQERPK